MTDKFVLYFNKMKQNPLLDRKQCAIQVLHPDSGNISKASIKTALAQKLKSQEDRISVFGMQTKFGGGRSSGFALIYASVESKRKFDSKTMCKRDGLISKRPQGRKALKEIKSRKKRVWATAKNKVQAGKIKKK